MAVAETVRVMVPDREGFVVIDAADFDPAVHELWRAPKPRRDRREDDRPWR